MTTITSNNASDERVVLLPVDLRDWFAGQALTGILAGGFADTIPHDDINGGGDAAFFAYQYADAMLKARLFKHEVDGGAL